MNFLKQSHIQIGLTFLIFGLMTILSGGRALFGEDAVSARGNIVPLVLWFNFIAGFFYVMAGISTLRLKSCVKKLSIVLAVLSALVLLYLANYIYQGGLYENKTVVAMTFRTTFWSFFAIYFQKSDMFKKIECNC